MIAATSFSGAGPDNAGRVTQRVITPSIGLGSTICALFIVSRIEWDRAVTVPADRQARLKASGADSLSP
jgi:hypothetical protein